VLGVHLLGRFSEGRQRSHCSTTIRQRISALTGNLAKSRACSRASASETRLALPKPMSGRRPCATMRNVQRLAPEASNMARFYSMAIERDLFGRVLLVRQWGRIGTYGSRRHDEHSTAAAAWAALSAIEKAKMRGYRATSSPADRTPST
jgi:predicted DNA-binding WGR domain protein